MRSLALALAIAVAGCAVSTRSDLPGPSDIPALRQSLLRDSADVGARIGLAVALQEAGEREEARSILEAVAADRPDDPDPQLLLGLASEEVGDFARAHAAYTRYLELPGSPAMRRSIDRRLRYVRRMELAAAARGALARESELTSLEPDARAVGVFPFVLQSPDSTLQPLSRALAHLLVTDLSQTDRLRVLERVELQLLLDELELAGSGLVDPATAARAGRLMRAGKVVQGRIEGGEAQLRLEAVVVGVGRDTVGALSPLAEQDPLDRLFDMEKRLALGLYASLGIVLTVAEEERVLRRPTANVQALLEFGRGLEAEDRGDWAAAVRHYGDAAALDPGFGQAVERGDDVGAIAEAEAESAGGLVRAAVEAEAIPVTSLAGGGVAPPLLGGTGIGGGVIAPDPLVGSPSDPMRRDPGPEVLGGEGLGMPTLLRIIFRRPGG